VLALSLALWLRHAPAPVPAPPRRIPRIERIGWACGYLLLPLLVLAWSFARQLAAGHPPWLSTSAIGHDAAVFLRGTALSLVAVSLALRIRLLAAAS
jgi:hypothetical protein